VETGHTGTADRLRGDRGAPGLIRAALLLVALAAIYWSTGALIPGEHLPRYATSASQITGMALMLILLPSYILAAWSIGQRRSLDLLEQLRPLVPDPADADAAARAIRAPLGVGGWVWGSLVGVCFGLSNTDLTAAFAHSETPAIDGSISLGQIFMWWLIGVLLIDRTRTARAFRALGEVIRFDLFRLETLRPLARAGVIDVVIVAGALLFSPLQSLDARFRVENYRFALAVATPAMLFFVSWPLRSVHARIRAERTARLTALEAQLEALEAQLEALEAQSAQIAPDSAARIEATAELESLLAHRDRLLGARTWPLDLRLVWRIFIYLIIPPLAWAGAALVERMVDAALGAG
jgi:hypothetical protein